MERQSNPEDELNGLLNEAIKMALRLTEKHGCHVPFGMVISTVGERIDIAADDTEVRDVDVLFETVRRRILDGVRDNQFRAIALVNNVSFRLRPGDTPTDAVQIMLDHERGRASTCYLPYHIVDNRVFPAEIFATEAIERFFAK